VFAVAADHDALALGTSAARACIKRCQIDIALADCRQVDLEILAGQFQHGPGGIAAQACGIAALRGQGADFTHRDFAYDAQAFDLAGAAADQQGGVVAHGCLGRMRGQPRQPDAQSGGQCGKQDVAARTEWRHGDLPMVCRANAPAADQDVRDRPMAAGNPAVSRRCTP